MIAPSSTNCPGIVGFYHNKSGSVFPTSAVNWVFLDLVAPHTVILAGYLSEFDEICLPVFVKYPDLVVDLHHATELYEYFMRMYSLITTQSQDTYKQH